jgi:asparagine synthase (glutamine-hydrolysing)
VCGISGELRLDSGLADAAAIARMVKVLTPRGPDDQGIEINGGIGFGHRRLSIIDLSQRAHQPMLDNETGNWLVFNGTIYNYRALQQQLKDKGHRFVSDGDTEVILKAYNEWGADCVQHFQGMFAFALWDVSQRRLMLARDRLGIKPLYYNHTDNYIRFASNTQALLAAGEVDTSLDPVALHHHFSLHAVVPGPRTILNGIRKLPPAHIMLIDEQNNHQTHRYWDYGARRPDRAMTEQDWQQATHDALMAAVEKRRLAADVPVGVLLSGGLDSSLLVALLCEAGVTNLKTFSVGFEDMPEEKGSEFEYSDQVVARYQTEHYKFHIANDQVLKRLPEAVASMAEPMVGQDAVAFYLLAERVSQEVKVVQSGQGADEVFGGYFWYPHMAAETGGSYAERFARHYFDRDHDEFLAMLHPSLHGIDHTSAYVQQHLEAVDADEYLDRVLHLDVTTLIVDDPVKRVDNMTMAHGLEARVPFLDHELVELVAQMPPSLKLAEGGKGILKSIARPLLPAAVIDRPKGYFPVPALKFVRGEFLQFMTDILNSTACRNRDVYQRGYVDMLLAAPDQHFTRILGSKLWHLALLEFWLQTNVDQYAKR